MIPRIRTYSQYRVTLRLFNGQTVVRTYKADSEGHARLYAWKRRDCRKIISIEPTP